LISSSISAQVNLNPESDHILQALKQLPYKTSILYIAAHPDDENNRLLTYLVKGRHLRTGYLALTRGEGGQNLIGKEQGETLGLIRTEELLAARAVDGAEQYFSRAIDFGFSKNPEETLKFWNRDSILSDMVWVIREFQPDIIMDRFPTTGEGGHGNHTASAILTLEAVKLAGNPSAFPRQLVYCQPWQVKKVYWNTFNFGGLNTTAVDQVHFQVNSYDPLLGMTYGDLAAKSRSNHKSQGFGTGSAKGEQYEYLKSLTGPSDKTNFLEGLDSTWSKASGADSAYNDIEKAIGTFNAEKPEAIIPLLTHAYGQILNWADSRLKTEKIQAISRIILACLGLQVECTSSKGTLSYNAYLPFEIHVLKGRDFPAFLEKYRLPDGRLIFPNSNEGVNLTLGKNLQYNAQISLDSSYLTQPYQLRLPHSPYRYEIKNPNWIGSAKTPNKLQVTLYFKILGQEIQIPYPLVVKYIDPVKGEFFEPISIVPPISLEPDSKIYIFKNSNPRKVKLSLINLEDSLNASIRLKLPSGWTSVPKEIPVHLKAQFEGRNLEFSLIPPPGIIKENRVDSAYLEAEIKTKGFSETVHTLKYDHIPWITYSEPAKIKLVRLPLVTPPVTVAYLMGAGDYIPEVLNQIGYPVHLLSDEEFNEEELKKYHTLILGVRAYNTRNVLKFSHDLLMNFVKNGGTLLVQYNTNNNLLTNQLGPYPLSLDRDRVTDENAAVHFLNPNASLLNYPNKILESDFKDWIQERGLYFPRLSGPDSPYQTLLSMHDPGESDLKTAIIYCPYGKGLFIYTSLVFFRELPAGNPGSIRLFVNLLNGKP
jgi:LmbE family N-acetylglucosaminyl deacetylase